MKFRPYRRPLARPSEQISLAIFSVEVPSFIDLVNKKSPYKSGIILPEDDYVSAPQVNIQLHVVGRVRMCELHGGHLVRQYHLSAVLIHFSISTSLAVDTA